MGKKQEGNFSERDIPRLAKFATREAYKRSLKGGNYTVVRKGNNMVRVHQDGTVVIIKKLPPLIKVSIGTVIIINE
jgi:hypothetical protein